MHPLHSGLSYINAISKNDEKVKKMHFALVSFSSLEVSNLSLIVSLTIGIHGFIIIPKLNKIIHHLLLEFSYHNQIARHLFNNLQKSLKCCIGNLK